MSHQVYHQGDSWKGVQTADTGLQGQDQLGLLGKMGVYSDLMSCVSGSHVISCRVFRTFQTLMLQMMKSSLTHQSGHFLNSSYHPIKTQIQLILWLLSTSDLRNFSERAVASKSDHFFQSLNKLTALKRLRIFLFDAPHAAAVLTNPKVGLKLLDSPHKAKS